MRGFFKRAKLALILKACGSRISYERAFEELYCDIGNRFRLKSSELDQNRALLIVPNLSPGGAERQAAVTAIGLAGKSRWKPVVGCRQIEGADNAFYRASLERAQVPVVQIPPVPPEMNDPCIQAALARARRYRLIGFTRFAPIVLSYACFIRSLRPALVQTWLDHCNVLGGIASDMVGVPGLVLSGRNVAPDNFPTFHHPSLRSGYLALLRRRPDLVFTNNSHAGATDYGRWLGLPERSFMIIHNGSDFPETCRKQEAKKHRRALGIREDAQIVGCMMRFSEEKQPYLWVDAAIRVAREMPAVYFVAFGTGGMLGEVRSYVSKRRMSDRIKIPGLVHDAWTALAMFDVLLLASRLEGLPNVLIEAQGMGIPVVTTGVGGMLETYIDGVTGLTAQPPTAEALAAAVARLLLDGDLRARMAKQAQQNARSKFSVDSMLGRTLDAFHLACLRQDGSKEVTSSIDPK